MGIRNKKFERYRICGYGLPKDILSKGQKPQPSASIGLKIASHCEKYPQTIRIYWRYQ